MAPQKIYYWFDITFFLSFLFTLENAVIAIYGSRMPLILIYSSSLILIKLSCIF